MYTTVEGVTGYWAMNIANILCFPLGCTLLREQSVAYNELPNIFSSMTLVTSRFAEKKRNQIKLFFCLYVEEGEAPKS